MVLRWWWRVRGNRRRYVVPCGGLGLRLVSRGRVCRIEGRWGLVGPVESLLLCWGICDPPVSNGPGYEEEEGVKERTSGG